MRKIRWFARWLLCWAFGHAGDSMESGYHVCDRCGLHGYWSFRETSGEDIWPEYCNAGYLSRPYWRLQERYNNWRYERKYGKNNIPF